MSNLRDVKEASTKVVLDKERHMRFDLNAFAVLEERFGDMNAAFEALQSGSMKAVRTLLWAGLVHEDPELTEQKVGAIVTLDRVQEIVRLVTDSIQSALPDVEGDMGKA